MNTTMTVCHPGPFYCPKCNAKMMENDKTVRCLMMSCKNYSIEWDKPKVVLTKTSELKNV